MNPIMKRSCMSLVPSPSDSRLPRLLRSHLLRGRATRGSVLALLALVSCFHGGAPSVPASASLTPLGPDAVAARSASPFAVVYAAPRGKVADRKQPGVTV